MSNKKKIVISHNAAPNDGNPAYNCNMTINGHAYCSALGEMAIEIYEIARRKPSWLLD
jgi:hypothetical protein